MKSWQRVSILALSAMMPSQVVLAADSLPATVVDGAATAISTAQVNVMGESLALLQVPDLQFESLNVGDLIDHRVTLALASGAVTKDGQGPGFDGDDQKRIVVEDFRGTNSGWQLLVKLDAFQLVGTSTTLTPQSAQFATSNATGTNATGIALANVDFAGMEAPVVTAPIDRGSGTTTLAITAATLTLPQTGNVLAGDYRAALDWLLLSGPQP